MTQGEAADKASIRITELVSRLIIDRWFIAGSAIFGLILGLLYLMTTAPTYTATLTITSPSSGEAPSQGSQIFSSLGLDNMLNGGGSNTFQLYLDLLTTEAVAQRIENEHHVLRQIFADRWDAKSGQWRRRAGVGTSLSDAIHWLIRRPPSPAAPNIEDLTKFFAGQIHIDTPTLNSQVRVITFSYQNPQLAADCLMWLHEAADGLIRDRARARTRGSIDYLTQRLPEVTNADEHYALTQLLVKNEQDLTLLSINADYSAAVVDPAIPPLNPSPAIGITLMLFIVTGLSIGCILIIAFPGFVDRYFRLIGIKTRLSVYPQKMAGAQRYDASQEFSSQSQAEKDGQRS